MDGSLAPWLKWVLSALLALHVLAVIVPPFAFASRVGPGDTSPIADLLTAALEPYYQAMYLDHGYFFFAPNPGPTHQVRYTVEFADGRKPIDDVFPNLMTQRPRLLYHRHFMMAEALTNMYAPPQPPPEPSPPPITAPTEERQRFALAKENHLRDVKAWEQRRRQYESMFSAFEQHLKRTHGASKVTLTRWEHRPAAPWEVRDEGKGLDDKGSYLELPETIERPTRARMPDGA